MEAKLTVGQKLYRRPKSRGSETDIVEVEINKIGKKYFYAGVGYNERAFSLVDLWFHDKNYNQNDFRLYLTKEEIIMEDNKNKLYNKIQDFFRYNFTNSKFTLEQLQVIEGIIFTPHHSDNKE